MERKVEVAGVLVIFAGVWFVQFRPAVEAPYTPDKNLIDTTAREAGDYMAANNPWSKGDGSDEASSIYYPNCEAARAAGAAPVRLGDPGYAAHLDRDGDGAGCEPYYGR